MTFYIKYGQIVFKSFEVVEWSPFGKELLIQLTVCSLCIISFCIFLLFHVLVLRSGF